MLQCICLTLCAQEVIHTKINLCLSYILGNQNPSDTFTKVVYRSTCWHLCEKERLTIPVFLSDKCFCFIFNLIRGFYLQIDTIILERTDNKCVSFTISLYHPNRNFFEWYDQASSILFWCGFIFVHSLSPNVFCLQFYFRSKIHTWQWVVIITSWMNSLSISNSPSCDISKLLHRNTNKFELRICTLRSSTNVRSTYFSMPVYDDLLFQAYLALLREN